MEKYCRECGCEILSEDDIGYEEESFIICGSCQDDEIRAWEAFQLTDEYKYECMFNEWVKSDVTKT